MEKDSIKVRDPEPFDGSDPWKIRTFLIQCQLNFNAKPSAFHSDEAKVNYALSYLKGTALEWFEPHLLYASVTSPDWLNNYGLFKAELNNNFRPHDPIGEAEAELKTLQMKDSQHIMKYSVHFNRLAAMVGWDNSAL